jgi:hypothetical protein
MVVAFHDGILTACRAIVVNMMFTPIGMLSWLCVIRVRPS